APEHGTRAFQRLARRRNRRLVDARGLAEIERVELALGRRDGRPRVKLATVPELLAAAKGGRRRIPG
ncbi:ferredoxin-NADP reductase, partial [Streptomyces sp. FT05W]